MWGIHFQLLCQRCCSRLSILPFWSTESHYQFCWCCYFLLLLLLICYHFHILRHIATVVVFPTVVAAAFVVVNVVAAAFAVVYVVLVFVVTSLSFSCFLSWAWAGLSRYVLNILSYKSFFWGFFHLSWSPTFVKVQELSFRISQNAHASPCHHNLCHRGSAGRSNRDWELDGEFGGPSHRQGRGISQCSAGMVWSLSCNWAMVAACLRIGWPHGGQNSMLFLTMLGCSCDCRLTGPSLSEFQRQPGMIRKMLTVGSSSCSRAVFSFSDSFGLPCGCCKLQNIHFAFHLFQFDLHRPFKTKQNWMQGRYPWQATQGCTLWDG